MRAPKVVAKGQDFLALRIRERAPDGTGRRLDGPLEDRAERRQVLHFSTSSRSLA